VPEKLQQLVAANPEASSLYSEVGTVMRAIPPFSLGFPSNTAQSMYYPGDCKITQQEIKAISHAMEQWGIFPENTRIEKVEAEGELLYYVLQASSQSTPPREYKLPENQARVLVKTGDHSIELSKICANLNEATKCAANSTQKQVITQYIRSFETGDLQAYRGSQRTWVTDLNPRVENIFGFVEPYRDPFGIRAEFEGLVAISDPEETKTLAKLVEHSDQFIRRLPWAAGATENNRKGPFEKSLFEPPDFTSIHGMMCAEQVRMSAN
jgi:dipeptidyl-peptidase III